MQQYKLCPKIINEQVAVQRLLDGAFIPFDPANTDYQAFLLWCEQGNTPEPAEVTNEQL